MIHRLHQYAFKSTQFACSITNHLRTSTRVGNTQWSGLIYRLKTMDCKSMLLFPMSCSLARCLSASDTRGTTATLFQQLFQSQMSSELQHEAAGVDLVECVKNVFISFSLSLRTGSFSKMQYWMEQWNKLYQKDKWRGLECLKWSSENQ